MSCVIEKECLSLHAESKHKRRMRKYLIIAIAVLGMASCSKNKFHVEGNITNAKDSVLYFEHVGLEQVDVLDSVKLGDDGAFAFAEEALLCFQIRSLSILISECPGCSH